MVMGQAAPGADQQPEPLIEPIPDLNGRHRRHPRGHAVGAVDEQAHRGRVDSSFHIQCWHRPDLLVSDTQPFAAGGQNRHRDRGREDRLDQLGGGVEHMLAVVDQQQP
jgi:hypothetical protein